MRTTIQVILLLVLGVYAKEDETNEISPHRPPINLDANLRRALLKALTELENEENAKLKQQSSSNIEDLPQLDTRDKIIEKASASAVSFFTNTNNNFVSTTEKLTTTTTSTTTAEQETERPIVVIQRSKGLQHKPITEIENKELDAYNEAEQILTSATSSFTSPDKFAYVKSSDGTSVNTNILANEYKTIEKQVKIQTTTPVVTTSTEESEAKVEDVQFFSAPLVAAFTVHQDERGLPKSVVPIYKSTAQNSLVQKKQIQQQQKLLQFDRQQEESKKKQEQLRQEQEKVQTELALKEKQKLLEQEILKLKQQQQQQNYLIRQQQILHEQQLRLQKEKLLQEEVRIRNNQQPFLPVVSSNLNQFATNQQTHINNQQFSGSHNNNSRVKGTLVSFQPSVTFNSNEQLGVLPLNARQLPTKAAADFNTPLIPIHSYRPFNYISQQNPPSVSSVPNFNFIQNVQPQQNHLPQHNRVFRQEANTGNFFNNGHSNSNNHFNQISLQPQHLQEQQNTRFFRSNLESTLTSPQNFNRVQPPVINHHLNNLLYNSGVYRGNRQQEDLNIISKVLSLNHYGGDYRLDSSNINEQRIVAPSIKKV